jgi:hypothetical protein
MRFDWAQVSYTRVSRWTLSVAGLLIGVSMNLGGPARTEVFHSRESALRLAFPSADSVSKREIFLSSEEAEEAQKLARAELPSRLVTMYVGHKNGDVQGYAFIETHPVRSLPETILIVIDPDGRTRGVHILAFHEPPEYAPAARWLEQFQEVPLTDELSLRGDVAAITGARKPPSVRETRSYHCVLSSPVSGIAISY